MPASQKSRVNFALHAPDANEVFIAGTFNDWDPQVRRLRCDKKGTWRTWMNLPAGQHEYRFIVNGDWQEDPQAGERAYNPFGTFNSVVSV
ncbi:MAG: isoamylase early set domain-containing protein [Candidatus Latescibacterota bacterium]|jgi:1,4-alpha-glucan branching enzyme